MHEDGFAALRGRNAAESAVVIPGAEDAFEFAAWRLALASLQRRIAERPGTADPTIALEMNKTLLALFSVVALVLPAHALIDQSPPAGLTTAQPPCKTPPIKRPQLKAEQDSLREEGMASARYDRLVADFNGDGWCDVAWKVPYPRNSHMKSYWLEDLLILGSRKRWFAPLRGKRPWSRELHSLNQAISPTFQVDLTEVALVHPNSPGAPYLLGLISGPDWGTTPIVPGCAEYSSVYRWDQQIDAFKKVDENTRDAVISFYYATVGKRCARPEKPRN